MHIWHCKQCQIRWHHIWISKYGGCTFGIEHNANYAGTTSELASMGMHIWHCIQCQICRHHIWISKYGGCTFGIVYNAKYAGTNGESGSPGGMYIWHWTQCQICISLVLAYSPVVSAYLALYTMPNMHSHVSIFVIVSNANCAFPLLANSDVVSAYMALDAIVK